MAGGPTATGAFPQFVVGPILGLAFDVTLDELAGDLVAPFPGDGFQLRELGPSREPSRIEFSTEFPSHSAQASMKFPANFGGILAHVRGPLQIANQIERKAQTSIGKVTATPLAVQTMSCARSAASTLSLLTITAHPANVPADCPVTCMSGC